MIRRWLRHVGGATAVEFALVVPFLMTLLAGAIQLSIIVWNYNALQSAAAESARCVALQLSACATVTSGCDSATPAVCYTEAIAVKRGIPSLSASQVTVNAAVTYSSVSFTTITISYPYSFLTFSGTLTATGMFPNA